MVKCVLISEKLGEIREIESPLQRDIYALLKGPGTFLGQYEDVDVVIMKCRERESLMELVRNENKLPKPFDEELVLGPILLVRMNEASEPEDFTLQEYYKLADLNLNPILAGAVEGV
jgi:hypothetical protein